MENPENLNITEAEKRSPFLTMWFWPRKTIRRVLKTTPQNRIIFFLLFYCLNVLLSNISDELTLRLEALSLRIFLNVIMAPVVTICGFYISSWLIHWVGKKLGGKAAVGEVRIIIARLSLLQILLFPFFVLEFLGRVIIWYFNSPTLDVYFQTFFPILKIFTFIFSIITSLWILVLEIICLSEVNGFSKRKAFLNIILPMVIVMIPISGCIILLALLL